MFLWEGVYINCRWYMVWVHLYNETVCDTLPHPTNQQPVGYWGDPPIPFSILSIYKGVYYTFLMGVYINCMEYMVWVQMTFWYLSVYKLSRGCSLVWPSCMATVKKIGNKISKNWFLIEIFINIQSYRKNEKKIDTVHRQKDPPFSFFRREVSFCPILTLNSSKWQVYSQVFFIPCFHLST